MATTMVSVALYRKNSENLFLSTVSRLSPMAPISTSQKVMANPRCSFTRSFNKSQLTFFFLICFYLVSNKPHVSEQSASVSFSGSLTQMTLK